MRNCKLGGRISFILKRWNLLRDIPIAAHAGLWPLSGHYPKKHLQNAGRVGRQPLIWTTEAAIPDFIAAQHKWTSIEINKYSCAKTTYIATGNSKSRCIQIRSITHLSSIAKPLLACVPLLQQGAIQERCVQLSTVLYQLWKLRITHKRASWWYTTTSLLHASEDTSFFVHCASSEASTWQDLNGAISFERITSKICTFFKFSRNRKPQVLASVEACSGTLQNVDIVVQQLCSFATTTLTR